MAEGANGRDGLMQFNIPEYASRIKQEQDRASIEALRAEIEALKTRVKTLEDA